MSHLTWQFSFSKEVMTAQAKDWLSASKVVEGRSQKSKKKREKLPQRDCHSPYSSHGKAKELREQHTLVWMHQWDLEQIEEKEIIKQKYCMTTPHCPYLTPSDDEWQRQRKFNQEYSAIRGEDEQNWKIRCKIIQHKQQSVCLHTKPWWFWTT